MGADIAGVVEAVGEGVPYRPGDKVFGDISATGLGGFSELAIATPEQIALMPETSFEAASCLGVAGLTALQMWRHAGLGPGHRVLVVGASGGVGHLAVQVAKAHGAHVTATTTTKKVPFVEALGADVVLDRSTTDAVDHGPYDIILDNGAFRDLRDYVPALSPEGVYVMVGGSGPAMMQALLRGKRIFGKGRCIVKTAKAVHEDLATLSHMVDAGALVPHIDKRFSLHETAEAIAYLEAGTIQGKVVVVMDAVSNP